MTRNPKKRLGCHPQHGFDDIKNHPFYNGIDFDLAFHKKLQPTFIPNNVCFYNILIKKIILKIYQCGADLVANVDPTFKNDSVDLTPSEDTQYSIDEESYKGNEIENKLISKLNSFQINFENFDCAIDEIQ